MSEELNNEIAVDMTTADKEVVTATAVVEKKKQSKLGITSFIMAIAAGIIVVIGFVITTVSVTGAVDPATLSDPNALMASDIMSTMVITGLVIMFGGFVSFIGLIIGIVALFMKKVKKGFAIAGTIMNGIPIILTVVLFIIGMAMQTAAGV